MGKIKIIVNADDLGGSKIHTEVNFRLIEEGIISSSTLLVNHNYSEETGALLRGEKAHLLPAIGLHWNLIDYEPVSEAMRRSPFVGTDGRMREFRKEVGLWTQWKHRRAVLAELEAQLAAFERLTGGQPSHIDAHGHAHISLPGLWALWKSKAAHRVGKVRIARQYPLLPAPGLQNRFKRMAVAILNWFLRRRYRTVQRFIDIRFLNGEFIQADYVQRVLEKHGTLEVMCHPNLGKNHSEREFLEAVKPFSNLKNGQLTNYSDL